MMVKGRNKFLLVIGITLGLTFTISACIAQEVPTSENMDPELITSQIKVYENPT